VSLTTLLFSYGAHDAPAFLGVAVLFTFYFTVKLNKIHLEVDVESAFIFAYLE